MPPFDAQSRALFYYDGGGFSTAKSWRWIWAVLMFLFNGTNGMIYLDTGRY